MVSKSSNLPLVRSDEQQLILDQGLAALRRINADKSWDDWKQVAAALKVVTDAAVEQAKSGAWNRDNKSAVRIFNRLWDEYETSDGSNQKPLSSSERTQLRFVIDHPEIEHWRDTLDNTKRRSLNHPNAVVSAWRKATQKPSDEQTSGAARQKADVIVALKKKLADAEKESEQAHRKLESRAPGDLLQVEEAAVALLKDAGAPIKIDFAKRLLARLGITNISKALKPATRRKPEPLLSE